MAEEINMEFLQLVVDHINNDQPDQSIVETINQLSKYNIELKYQVIQKLKSIKNDQNQ